MIRQNLIRRLPPFHGFGNDAIFECFSRRAVPCQCSVFLPDALFVTDFGLRQLLKEVSGIAVLRFFRKVPVKPMGSILQSVCERKHLLWGFIPLNEKYALVDLCPGDQTIPRINPSAHGGGINAVTRKKICSRPAAPSRRSIGQNWLLRINFGEPIRKL